MRRVLRGALILSTVALLAGVSCGAEVDLGATRLDLPAGAGNDAGVGGTGGTGGFGGIEGSGGSVDFDAGPDGLGDSAPQPDGAPPQCPLTPVLELSRDGCEKLLPQLLLPQPWADIVESTIFRNANVLYRSPLGEERIIGSVDSAEDCAGVVEGWYVLDPRNPRRIVLCPETCAAIEADGGQLFAALGCERVRAEPR
jgi:hypothetical protein